MTSVNLKSQLLQVYSFPKHLGTKSLVRALLQGSSPRPQPGEASLKKRELSCAHIVEANLA